MADWKTIVCMTVKQMPTPPTLCAMRTCDLCGCAIWVALSSPKVDEYLCVDCAVALHKSDPPKLEPLTPEQIADARQALRRRHQ